MADSQDTGTRLSASRKQPAQQAVRTVPGRDLFDTLGNCSLDQFIPWVIDGRCAGIRDKCHVTLRECSQNGIELGQFIMLVVTGQRGMDVKMG